MVFENLTLFELHLENARFGPTLGGEEEPAEESTEAATGSDEEGGRGMGRPLGFLLFVAILALAARRYRSRGSAVEELAEEESEQITIEHAAEQ